jgi:hypothetical protein
MHRLTQAILRDRLTPGQAAATRACTEAILAASRPRRSAQPGHVARWAQLMPHLLAADLAATGQPRACAGWPATRAGTCWPAAIPALPVTWPADLRQHWRDRLGDDHEHTLAIATYLAWALQDMGRYAEGPRPGPGHPGPPPPGARRGPPDTLALGEQPRQRPALAWGSIRRPATWTRTPWTAAAGCWARTTPDTLTSANNLAIDLSQPRRVSGGPRPGPGHPGPPPPGARRGPPRHPGLSAVISPSTCTRPRRVSGGP